MAGRGARFVPVLIALAFFGAFFGGICGGICGGAPHTALAQTRPKAAPPAAPSPAPAKQAPAYAPLVVLTLDSEDSGDQADALSGALRSRVRVTSGLTLVETQTSFAMFAGALACPPKPDAACLQKIAQQLKVDRFVWGTVSKGKAGSVAADVHLWDHGKDTARQETFSDNLKDQNDEALRKIAARVLGALTGSPVAGFVSVEAKGISETSGGSVWVDGAQAATLEHRRASFEVKPGDHVVQVQVAGYVAARRRVQVASGVDVPMSVDLEPLVRAPEEKPSRPISTRAVLALTSIGVGVGFGVAGTVEAVRFMSRQSQNSDDHKSIDAVDFCDKTQPHTGTDAQLDAACQNLKSAKSARLLEGIFYGVSAVFLGTGAVLFITDHKSDDEAAKASPPTSGRPHFAVEPHAGPKSGQLDLRITF